MHHASAGANHLGMIRELFGSHLGEANQDKEAENEKASDKWQDLSYKKRRTVWRRRDVSKKMYLE